MLCFLGLYSHLQDKSVAAGGFIRVYQANYVGMLQPMEQTEFLSHFIPSHQSLVHLFNCNSTFGTPVVATLNNRETAPGINT